MIADEFGENVDPKGQVEGNVQVLVRSHRRRE